MSKAVNIDEKDVINEVKKYIQNEESLNLINKALEYAKFHHATQFRRNGDPYIIHIFNVGYILATLRVSPTTICAGLLHDIIEDCDITKEELAQEFNEEIAEIVESVTKIGNIQFKDMKEYQAANHRKLLIAMAKDIRVIFVKLVDRLHNMRTLQFMPIEKQKRIASETLGVYAPIAHRLGISEIKNELEDLSFLYLMPEEYHHIARLVEAKKVERDNMVKKMIIDISNILNDNKIPFRVFGRSKHLYSIYKKMTVKHKRFEEILDLLAIRIITKTELNCYETLGYIHANYLPIPGRLKDYIAMPKVNMYQSLHTTIMSDEGSIFEIQIRTEEMDSIAERGVAAHWRYKEGRSYDAIKEQKEIEERLSWFKDITSFSTDSKSDTDYMESLTKDVFEANVYVMTPNGRVIALPNGATTIDFAYKVHTDVGHSATGAIVNDGLVPLNTVLKTGDVVQIRTSKQITGPSEDWLKFVKTNQARNKIKNFLAKKEIEKKQDKVEAGEKIFCDELKKRGFDVKEYFDKKKIEAVLPNFQLSSYMDLMYAIATKSINLINFIEKLTNQKRPVSDNELLDKINSKDYSKKTSNSKKGLKVSGIDSIMMSIAQCCNPVYQDEIKGYISKGQGVKVHRSNCPNILNSKNRLIDVYWDDEVKNITYDANISVIALDRNFLFTDIVTVVSQHKATLKSINSTVNQEDLTATTKMIVQVLNLEHLNNLISNLRKIDNVISVERIFI